MKNVLDLVIQFLGYNRFMLGLYELSFLAFVLFKEYLSAIDGVGNASPKEAFGSFKSLFPCHLIDLFCIIGAFGYLFKRPPDSTG
ncbi:MAG: hypothetical protein P4L51_04000 [Puia sp.]|nr:hypothetical protein [Puia sp.]